MTTIQKEIKKAPRFSTTVPDTLILGDLQESVGMMVRPATKHFEETRNGTTSTVWGQSRKIISVLKLKGLEPKDIHNPDVILKLAETAIDDSDVGVRALSVGVFLHLGDKSHVPKLLERFDEEDFEVFGNASMALVKLSGDSDSETRRMIITHMIKALSSDVHCKDRNSHNSIGAILYKINQDERDSLTGLFIDEFKNSEASKEARGILVSILGSLGNMASSETCQTIIETLKEAAGNPKDKEQGMSKFYLKEMHEKNPNAKK